ncbi:MAG: esterase family protein [Streptosporangiaceae bacterium]
MDTSAHELYSPAIGAAGTVLRYGHWGRPVLAFPAEAGSAGDFAAHGMLDPIGGLICDGRVKLYCVDAFDGSTWSRRDLPLEERARQHGRYESWILDQVVPFIAADCAGRADIITTGVSMGAFHAVNFALRRADLFGVAIGLSGNYDPASWHGWGERGDALYFNDPVDYVPNLHGPHLDWLRGRLCVVLVVGQGPFEVQPTGALPGMLTLAGLLRDRGIACELDVWGPDVAHDCGPGGAASWPATCRDSADLGGGLLTAAALC